jgi:hypothetical protein
MEHWRGKATEAAVVLLVIAFAAHLAWAWLQPLLPVLVVLVLLAVLYRLIFGRGRE